MIDINKLPTKTLLVAIAIISLPVLFIALLSYSSNQPFMINGKEYGFGAEELQKKTSELEACRDTASKIIAEAKRQLSDAKAENARLKEANSAFFAQQQARANHDAAMWFPVDDVVFLKDGTFSTQVGKKNGKGRWASPDSELMLQLIGMNSDEIVLETNLPPPGNKIRMTELAGVLVPMNKWEYRLSIRHIYPQEGEISVRIERRPKSQA